MDYEPISVALKFAFLGVLYLFLFWIVTSARRDLRLNRVGPDPDGSPFDPTGRVGGPGMRDAWLIVERSGELDPGSRYDLFGGLSLGRSADADVSFNDRYASGIHARIYSRGGLYFVEDMESTNGTLLNGRPIAGEHEVGDGSVIEIGDTAFRIEIE
ncbi:MAG: FHA domain-containing protein [Solirubrobacterales bacterium]|nr:FHA domain-containing protein [Solirubrobacterales bacterium]